LQESCQTSDWRVAIIKTGIGDDKSLLSFAAKPRLAQAILQRALEAGVSDAWVNADNV
jgi:SRSO17 transposase